MEDKDSFLLWETKSTKEVFKTAIFSIEEKERKGPNGQSGTFVVVNAFQWVNVVVPLTLIEGKTPYLDDFLMVKQYRHGASSITLEFPAGVIEKGEAPLMAAKRELKEESGYISDEFHYLGAINPNPAIMGNRTHTFVATNALKHCALNLDPLEALCPMIVKRSFIENEIKKGDSGLMNNAIMVMVWHLFICWENDFLKKDDLIF